MGKSCYIYRVLYLELHVPIKINDTISLLPRESSLDEKNYNIDFNKDEYSFILIESEEEIKDKNLLQKKVELILTILSAFLCNQFYCKENYCLKVENMSYKAIFAKIVPFPNRFIKKVRNYSFLSAPGIQRHFGEIFSTLLENPLSDSLFYLMATLMACLRESIVEVSSILAWNFLEHLASRYWKSENEDYLLKINQKKFDDYISTLKDTALKFIKDEIKKEDLLLTGEHSKVFNITNLLTSGISSKILPFSPVKYRILSMFEKEGILEDTDEEKIKTMNLIRNLLLHDGLSLIEISSHKKIKDDPKEFNAIYKAFLYRKFLMLLRIIEDHAEFKSGRLILKEEYIEENRLELQMKKSGGSAEEIILSTLKISAEKGKKEIQIEKANILKHIGSFLTEFQVLRLRATLRWNSKDEDFEIEINYNLEKNEYLLKVNNPSAQFAMYCYSPQFQTKGDRPEDNQQLVNYLIFKSNFKEYNIKALVFPSPIKFNISDRRILGFSQAEEEGEFITFQIEEIIIHSK